MDVNNVCLSGRIVRDAEIKATQTTDVCSFAIANTTGYGDKEYTNFVDCVLFGNRATGLAQYLTQGKQVFITGTWRQNRWEKDGQKRSRNEIIVDTLVFGKDKKADAGAAQPTQQPAQPQANVPAANADPLSAYPDIQF